MQRPLQSLAVVSMVAACSGGCLFHPLQKPVRPPEPLPESVSRNFGAPHSSANLTAISAYPDTNSIRRVNRHFSFEQLTLTNAQQTTGRAVQIDYYFPKDMSSGCAKTPRDVGKPQKYPAILILPIMGGKHYDLEAYFAKSFAKRGFVSAILHRPDIMKEVQDVQEIDKFLRQSVEDAQAAIDWLETQPAVDPGRIGLFGVSLGAIRATLVLGLDQRVRAAVLGLVGGDLPYILTHSREKGLARQRDKMVAEQNISLQEAEEKLREIINCDPLVVAPAVDPSRVLMVIAAFDRSIPATKGWELRRKLGNPATIQLFSGHYTAVIYAPYLRWKSGRFFEKQLGIGDH